MSGYSLKMPEKIFCGNGAIHAMQELNLTDGKDCTRIAIFSDPGIVAAGILHEPVEILESLGVQTVLIDTLPSEPTARQVIAAVDAFRASGATAIVAVGGGSVLDMAKLVSILYTDEYTLWDLIENPQRGKKQTETILIPTTAGTGSEATPNGIVTLPDEQLKVGIVCDAMMADVVILDPAMTRSMPKEIAAATGIDALAHALECYTSRKATPFSDMFAMEALQLIFSNIEQACNFNIEEARNAMQLAAFYAGVAITASGTTMVHALSYPLGGRFHIPHGISNAILLSPVMRFNEPACRGRFAALYDRLYPGETGISAPEKSGAVVRHLESIVEHLGIPKTLHGYGVRAEHLDELTDAGMKVTRLLDNNLRKAARDDVSSIYEEILA